MASSARRRPTPDPFAESLAHALASAFPLAAPRRIAVGLSGGADSSLLLHYAHAWSQETHASVVALHVHHGLSPNADSWAEHCSTLGRGRGIDVYIARVAVDRRPGTSLEACAREARYRAFETLCREHRVDALLLGHNATDQAETLLINLLRGSGVAGIAAMPAVRRLGPVQLVRPFLEIKGDAIRECVRALSMTVVEDESNRDPALLRNALRQTVLPALSALVPDAIDKLSGAAQRAAEAQGLLDSLGLADLARDGVDANGFSLTAVNELDRPRAANALRAWFRTYRRHSPSAAALGELIAQLSGAAHAAGVEFVHEGERFGVVRDRVCVRALASMAPIAPHSVPAPLDFTWSGEAVLEWPLWRGRLWFDSAVDQGVAADWLRNRPLQLRARSGGERLKLAAQRPSRTLKNLYQEANIKDSERAQLPLVFAGAQIVFAAGVGTDVRVLSQAHDVNEAHDLVALRWESV